MKAKGNLAPPALEQRIAQRLIALRTERGWSLEALAGKSGISRATLSRIERGELSATATVLGRLCSLYGWTLSRLITDAENHSASIIRGAQQVVWKDPESGYLRRSVSPPASALRAELVEVRFPAGETVVFASSPVPGLEHHLWVLEGALDLTVEGTLFRLQSGDCLRYILTGATTFHCPGKRDARYILALVHP